MIPLADPSAAYKHYKKQIDLAIKRVLDSGCYVLGKEVEAFEDEFAAFHGKGFYSVGVANGTDAIALCLRSLGLMKNDEVITSSHTAVATIAGIEQAGCIPVFSDIDPITRCIHPASIEKRISPKTKAIMPVHIYGQPCNMAEIQKLAKKHRLEIIEDCSQAHGAEIQGQKVGTFGSLAAFSCYPTKNLGCLGDGGVILCKSSEIFDKIKFLRQYGWDDKRESTLSGVNSRLDEIQAAILRVKLCYLSVDNEKRRQIARKYNEAFKNLPITLPFLNPDQMHAMHLYVIESDDREELLAHLRKNHIGANLHYPLPVHLHSAYFERFKGRDDLPHTESFYKRHLTLPLYPELPKEHLQNIISVICGWFSYSNNEPIE